MTHKNLIEHCGGSIPTDQTFIIENHPNHGDYVVLYSASCGTCSHNAYAYWTQYFDGKCTEVSQANKVSRRMFDFFIRTNLARKLEKRQQDMKDTRAKVIGVGEYTLKMKSSDPLAFLSYMKKILQNSDRNMA